MNLLENIQSIYFVGIGGIGMSALARFALKKNIAVFGYDKTATGLTATLEKEGAVISFVDNEVSLPQQIKDTASSLVVYTPAIPEDNKILQWFTRQHYKIMKRSELLGALTQDTLCLAVAGTHGKTTTSAILGHLLAY